ncbi:MAG: hypothetical protein HYS24_13080 [Ignavibacteriales bacterium]|nr:hypothetical protein [Ignavibacteriales bacterium]MBK7979602.1 hypothetical protein [Ignavibacteriota bacterium]
MKQKILNIARYSLIEIDAQITICIKLNYIKKMKFGK